MIKSWGRLKLRKQGLGDAGQREERVEVWLVWGLVKVRVTRALGSVWKVRVCWVFREGSKFRLRGLLDELKLRFEWSSMVVRMRGGGVRSRVKWN